MSITITYKGSDITDSVILEDYIHDSYSEFHADTLDIKFSDSEELWDKWNPQPGDEIQLINDSADTGIMYVKDLVPTPGHYLIKASSAPTGTDISRSETWDGITLFQLGKDIAGKYGLKFQTYSATDEKFEYLEQKHKADLMFYAEICALTGHAFLIYNKTLVLYGVAAMQNASASADVTISGENEFRFATAPPITGCKISNGSIEYIYKEATENIKNIVLNMAISSKADAMRYAENLCKWFNRDHKTGYFYTKPIASDFSAGSVINLETDITPSFNGKAFISRIRHHYSAGKTKIWIREV